MIISHKHRFIFIKAMKVAGSSLELALYDHLVPGDLAIPMSVGRERLRQRGVSLRRARLDGAEDLVSQLKNHSPLTDLIEGAGAQLTDYTVFAVERNPWDRAVSLFYWRHKGLRDADPYEVKSTFKKWLGACRFRSSFDKISVGGYCGADFLVRYERLQEGLDLLADKLRLDGQIDVNAFSEKRGIRPSTSLAFEELYDEQSWELIDLVAAREAKLMGYGKGVGADGDPLVHIAGARKVRSAHCRALARGASRREAKLAGAS